MNNQKLQVLILAGGSGTRFWPLSRETMPKQFLRVTGNRSMFEHTLRRARALTAEDRIRVVTIESQKAESHREILELGMPRVKILQEPLGRNTAAAIGLAVFEIAAGEPDAVVVVFPADHHIEQEKRFLGLVRQGCKIAQQDWLVTLGIKPTRPETGYGYIEAGPKLKAPDEMIKAFRSKRFIEKPDLKRAKDFIESAGFFWNSGIFIWKAGFFLNELKKYLPAHHRNLEAIHTAGGLEKNPVLTEKLYEELDKISVDHGILEKSDRVAVIPADVGWNDVGNWTALYDLIPKDKNCNVLQGDAVAVDTKESLIRSEERLVAALGVKGLVIVETADAVLVCSLNRGQDVKNLAEHLIKKGRQETKSPKKVLKPWGAYKTLDEEPGYQVKWLAINPGQRLSLQSHECRSEHWTVVAGKAIVTRDDEIIEVKAGQDIFIPRQSRHRVENPSDSILRIIEVQTGPYLGEDDIIRYEDDYGRTGYA